eukprot:tig00021012_g17025.t1
MTTRLSIPQEKAGDLAVSLYIQHGTTLKGPKTDYKIDVDDYLDYVHKSIHYERLLEQRLRRAAAGELAVLPSPAFHGQLQGKARPAPPAPPRPPRLLASSSPAARHPSREGGTSLPRYPLAGLAAVCQYPSEPAWPAPSGPRRAQNERPAVVLQGSILRISPHSPSS